MLIVSPLPESKGPSAHFRKASFEKPSFGLLLAEGERPLVGRSRFQRPAQSPAQVRPSRMREVVISQIATRQNFFNQLQTRLGAVAHRDGHGPIQLHYGGRFRPHQHVVKRDNPGPICC